MFFGIKEGFPKNTPIEEITQIHSERFLFSLSSSFISFNSLCLRLGISPEEIVDSSESIEDVLNRQKQYFEFLINEILKHSNEINPSEIFQILTITHGRFIKILLNQFCLIQQKNIENCSITTLDFIITSDEISSLSISVRDEIIDVDNKSNNNSLHEWRINDRKYRIVEIIPHEINNINHLSSL